MPDLKLRYPAGHFMSSEDQFNCMERAAAAVADRLECEDYEGNMAYIGLTEIDVHFMAYQPHEARLCTPFVVEVTGYNYPSRMADIQNRLLSIKSLFAKILGVRVEDISISFIPLPDGCWV